MPRHLKGTSIFLPKTVTGQSSQLRRAVYWLHLRQDIYNAFWCQRSIITDLSQCDFESGNESNSQSDNRWFHQTLYIAAKVLLWVYGEDASRAQWYELCKMADDWHRERPSSFEPIYFKARDLRKRRYFPQICYILDEHVAAAHFHYLAKLLLTAHDPNLPRIGPRVNAAAAEMRETGMLYVRTMVGIAACNSWVCARFTANVAIINCASWFRDRREQELLLEFLHDTSKCSGWEGRNAQKALMEEWGWKE